MRTLVVVAVLAARVAAADDFWEEQRREEQRRQIEADDRRWEQQTQTRINGQVESWRLEQQMREARAREAAAEGRARALEQKEQARARAEEAKRLAREQKERARAEAEEAKRLAREREEQARAEAAEAKRRALEEKKRKALLAKARAHGHATTCSRDVPPELLEGIARVEARHRRVRSIVFTSSGGFVLLDDRGDVEAYEVPAKLTAALQQARARREPVRLVSVRWPDDAWVLAHERTLVSDGLEFDIQRLEPAGANPVRILALYERGVFAVRGASELVVDSAPISLNNTAEFMRRLQAKERLDWFVPANRHFIAAFGDSLVWDELPPDLVEAIHAVQARNGVVEVVALTPNAGWVLISREL